MPRVKLTKTYIDSLVAPDPSGKITIYWDTDLKGFGVLVSAKKNTKTYVVQRDVYGKPIREHMLQTNVISLDKARIEAMGRLQFLAQGIIPKKVRRAEAEREERERRQAVTLKMALDDYLASRNNLRPKSIKEAKGIMARYLKEWENKPLREITRADAVAKHKAIKLRISADMTPDSRGTVKGGASANTAMRLVRNLYNYAKQNMSVALPENPVSGIEWFHEPRRTGVVKPSEMRKFYEAVRALPNPVAADYITLALFTGMRRGEAAALTWDEVDLAERVIRLPQGRTKPGRSLDLPMSDVVHDLLSKRRKLGVAEGGWVFPAATKSGHISEPRFALQDVAKASGVSIMVHDLRRTFITVAESCDISSFALKGLVNHSIGSGVTEGYIIIDAERLRGPMQRVADKLKELCGIK